MEQTKMDLRSEIEHSVSEATLSAIMSLDNTFSGLTPVHNRHEAYGVAAEHLAKVSAAVKALKDDVNGLLTTLSDPNRQAVEAASSIRNSASSLTSAAIWMTAAMQTVVRDLYTVENLEDPDEGYPMDEYAGGFEEADEE